MKSLSVLIPVLFIIALTAFVVYILSKKNTKKSEQETDYKGMFSLGTTFLSLGIVMWIVLDNPAFIGILGIGVVFMISGIANRDKWKDE